MFFGFSALPNQFLRSHTFWVTLVTAQLLVKRGAEVVGLGSKRGGFVGLPTAKEHPDKVLGLLVWGVEGRFEAWYFIEFPPPLISKAVNSHLDILHPAAFVVLVVVVLCLTYIFLLLSFVSLDRILLLTSRRSSTKNTIPHGIALLDATLGRM